MTKKGQLDFIEQWVAANQMSEYELTCTREIHGERSKVECLDIYPDMEARAKSENESRSILQVERIFNLVLEFKLSCSINFDYTKQLPFIHIYYFL